MPGGGGLVIGVWVLAGLLVWLALGLGIALLVGRVVRLRDAQGPTNVRHLSEAPGHPGVRAECVPAARQSAHSADPSVPSPVTSAVLRSSSRPRTDAA
ncbi:hypothetical protein BN12_220033 [Nostocoides japonicum T1-X7]|uniref:Uncharacterized protein n=1 Tax=Nostocoides japonicum T1-X7 TaxID=1194083 RepID=A0A077M0L8_9MICO|nr:hypothetical protein BN12_220033 [Tetrasphaera japonica T1-X7]